MNETNAPNLFDLSSGRSGKKFNKPNRPAEKPAPKPSPVAPPNNQEVIVLIQAMRAKHKELADKLDLAFKKSGHDPSELIAFFNDAANLAAVPEISWIQDKKENLEAQILNVPVDTVHNKKTKKILNRALKDRKGKTLGARKNWIDMR